MQKSEAAAEKSFELHILPRPQDQLTGGRAVYACMYVYLCEHLFQVHVCIYVRMQACI